MLPVNMMHLFFIQPKQALSFKENTKFIYLFKVMFFPLLAESHSPIDPVSLLQRYNEI